jgi:hypothetical protein
VEGRGHSLLQSWQRQSLLAQKRSVLDVVREDARSLSRRLNARDNRKLEEYLEGVREIEIRIVKEEQWLGKPPAVAPLDPPVNPVSGREEVDVMYALIVAALQTDSTRVITYRQPIESIYRSLGVSLTAHDVSHYASPEKRAASQQRDVAMSHSLATLIDQLKAVHESDGSRLFDHVSLAFGSNIRAIHYLDNCPLVLAGGGAGIRLGQHIVLRKHTPLCNVWLTLLHGSGIQVPSHGDSTGVVRELIA